MATTVQLPGGQHLRIDEATAEDVLQYALQELSKTQHLDDPSPAQTLQVVDQAGHLVANTQLVPKDSRVVAWGSYG